jgi:hypothetical protein
LFEKKRLWLVDFNKYVQLIKNDAKMSEAVYPDMSCQSMPKSQQNVTNLSLYQ